MQRVISDFMIYLTLHFKIVYSSVMDRMKPKNINEAFTNGFRGKPGAK